MTETLDSVAIQPRRIAPIKKEYLVLIDDKMVNWDFVAGTQLSKSGEHDDKVEKRPMIDDRDLPESQKKFKNKRKSRYRIGQRNNHSTSGGPESGGPRERVDKDKRLCLRMSETSMCPYNDKCDYSHDPYKIHKLKEEEQCDIKDQPCYIYSTYGKCPYATACNFARHHIRVIDSNKQALNLIDHNLWSTSGGREKFSDRFSNRLENHLQVQLRKRIYDFKTVDQIMNKLYQADNDVPDDDQNLNGQQSEKRIGAAIVDEHIKGRDVHKKKVDFKRKLYLAPLTTVGNLPFRRLCKTFGCDITCAEMSLCTTLLSGFAPEWSHLKRHESEDVFGVQITASHPDHAAKVAKVLNEQCDIDFIDINCSCPTESICQMGAGAGLMQRCSRLRKIIASCCMVSKVPVTIKMQSGFLGDKNIAHNLISSVISPFTSRHIGAITVYGRSRHQKQTKSADWAYINRCAEIAGDIPVIGSGDCISWQDYYQRLENHKSVSSVMLARGALISPWLFTEIKESRTWDISSRERLDTIRTYVNFALDHWGSDATGVENCRKYLLEWLSFSCRYIPVGLLDVLPQKINEQPPKYRGRDELETLLSSPAISDWMKISEMFLGKAPDGFRFYPKYKSDAYEPIVIKS